MVSKHHANSSHATSSRSASKISRVRRCVAVSENGSYPKVIRSGCPFSVSVVQRYAMIYVELDVETLLLNRYTIQMERA
jgi:hypothetical protein